MSTVRAAVLAVLRGPKAVLLSVLVLAPVLGGNLGLFSVADGFLLDSLPYREPSSLAMMRARSPSENKIFLTVPAEDISAVRKVGGIVSATGFTGTIEQRVQTRGDDRLALLVARVDRDFIRTLGVGLAEGRDISAGPPSEGVSEVVATKRAMRLLAARGVSLGETDRFDDGSQLRVVGVLQDDFVFPEVGAQQPDLLANLEPRPEMPQRQSVFAVVRLASMAKLAQVQTEAAARITSLHHDYPVLGKTDVQLSGLHYGLFEEYRQTFAAMLAIGLLVLFAATVTWAILLVDQAGRRRSEFEIRASLGATPRDLAVQLLLEVAASVAIVDLVALAVCAVATHYLLPQLRGDVYRLVSHGVNMRTVTFSLGVTTAIGLVAGTAPVISAIIGSRGLARPRRMISGRIQWALLACETGAATVVALTSFAVLYTVHEFAYNRLGYAPDNAFTVTLAARDLPNEQILSTAKQAMSALRQVPGVVAVGGSPQLPLSGVPPDGRIDQASGSIAQIYHATSGYFGALGIPIISGREFGDTDSDSVAIVSSALARATVPNGAIIGQVITTDDHGSQAQVVGVVGDIRPSFASDIVPTIYLPLSTTTRNFSLIVRTLRNGPTAEYLAGQVLSLTGRRARVQPLSGRTEAALSTQRLQALVASLWTVVVVCLAACGAVTVSARLISVRWKDFGIRLALGATIGQLARSSVWPSLLAGSTGIGVGVWLSLLLEPILDRVVVGLQRPPSADQITVCAVVLLLTTLGSAIAARRLTHLDAATVIRQTVQ